MSNQAASRGPGPHAAGAAIKEAAARITAELVAPGFAVEEATSALLLNSLLSAFYSRRRIYLNAFQRSGEVLDHFGHRLQRLEFNVHPLDPWTMIPVPRAQDVIVSLSGSLETEPVLVTLLHADREGLYRFVLTAQPAEDTRRQFQGVLPVHIPGVTARGLAARDDLKDLMPLGTLFELRAFLFLEAIAEVLAMCLSGIGERAPAAAGEPSPDLMEMLRRAREGAARVPELMLALVAQYRERLRELEEVDLGRLLAQLVDTARNGRTVYVTGFGRNNEIGGLFAHRLANLGMSVAMTPTRLERPSEPGDLLFALSGSGGTFEVLQRLSGARRSGLKTAVITATLKSPAVDFADTALLQGAAIESAAAGHFAEQRVRQTPVRKASESTFGLNSLLTLEAVVAVLMRELGKTEADLRHTDPWQGYDCPHPG